MAGFRLLIQVVLCTCLLLVATEGKKKGRDYTAYCGGIVMTVLVCTRGVQSIVYTFTDMWQSQVENEHYFNSISPPSAVL